MDVDSTVNTDNKKHLHVEKTDDSCKLEFFEIVPLTRDTDDSCTTECVSGDWSDEVKRNNLTVVKQEPDDVRCVISITFIIAHEKYVRILASGHIFADSTVVS